MPWRAYKLDAKSLYIIPRGQGCNYFDVAPVTRTCVQVIHPQSPFERYPFPCIVFSPLHRTRQEQCDAGDRGEAQKPDKIVIYDACVSTHRRIVVRSSPRRSPSTCCAT